MALVQTHFSGSVKRCDPVQKVTLYPIRRNTMEGKFKFNNWIAFHYKQYRCNSWRCWEIGNVYVPGFQASHLESIHMPCSERWYIIAYQVGGESDFLHGWWAYQEWIDGYFHFGLGVPIQPDINWFLTTEHRSWFSPKKSLWIDEYEMIPEALLIMLQSW